MRYIEPTRVKVLMMMFFATGSIGIVIGLSPVAGRHKSKRILTKERRRKNVIDSIFHLKSILKTF